MHPSILHLSVRTSIRKCMRNVLAWLEASVTGLLSTCSLFQCSFYNAFPSTLIEARCMMVMCMHGSGLLRLVAEVPIHEDALFWILTLGITRDLHLSTPDIIDLVDILVKRAALLHSAGTRTFL